MLNDLNDNQIKDLMAQCTVDTALTAKVLFPDRFSVDFSAMHYQICSLIDSGAPRIVVAAPRGFGKTSLVALALAGRKIIFRQSKFISYVSNSASSAELQTENLKHELMSNKNIKTLFGSIKHSQTGLDESFSKRAWVAGGNTLVYPRGSGQQIRGVLYHNARPDLFIIDDLEDTETIINDELRQKRKNWFHGDLMEAVSRVDDNYQIVYIDTLKHEDALLQDLLDSPDWESLKLEICDDNLKSNAPEFMSDEKVKEKYNYYKNLGSLDIFYREYRNIPISTEDAVFEQKYFKYYNETDKGFSGNSLFNVVIIDPAKTVKLHSADSAIVGWGISRSNKSMYLRDVDAGKFRPNELYDRAFAMVRRLNARILAIEVTSLNEFITQPIKNEMRKRGIFPLFVELKARAKKEERVAMLSPFYRQGYIYHNSKCCQKLESQLLAFPRPKLWDVADAAAYIVELMESQAQYFDPPDHGGDDYDEFAELEEENDKPLKTVGYW